MFINIARGSENTAAQRLSSWRKGTRRRERRATSPESARARARAGVASAQPQSEARFPIQRLVALSTRRAPYETTTSVTEAFCSCSDVQLCMTILIEIGVTWQHSPLLIFMRMILIEIGGDVAVLALRKSGWGSQFLWFHHPSTTHASSEWKKKLRCQAARASCLPCATQLLLLRDVAVGDPTGLPTAT